MIALQKAKNILEAHSKEEEISYAQICLKLGLLFLSEGKVQEAENIVKFALLSFNRHSSININKEIEEVYEDERVECYEILARCYELK